MEAHARLEEASRKRGVALDLVKTGSVYLLTMVAKDRPFLFASVAGTLSGFGMNIVKAEAFANRHGVVLDTFSFADPSRTLELNPTEIDRLRSTLERVILGKLDVRQLLQNRPKPAPPSRKSTIESRVSFDGKGPPPPRSFRSWRRTGLACSTTWPRRFRSRAATSKWC